VLFTGDFHTLSDYLDVLADIQTIELIWLNGLTYKLLNPFLLVVALVS